MPLFKEIKSGGLIRKFATRTCEKNFDAISGKVLLTLSIRKSNKKKYTPPLKICQVIFCYKNALRESA